MLSIANVGTGSAVKLVVAIYEFRGAKGDGRRKEAEGQPTFNVQSRLPDPLCQPTLALHWCRKVTVKNHKTARYHCINRLS
jgi:hypothetical protein